MSAGIERGTCVRRKNDHSGRVRRVGEIQTDAAGERHVTLNDYLDGWLIWNADDLIAVTQEQFENGCRKTKSASKETRRH